MNIEQFRESIELLIGNIHLPNRKKLILIENSLILLKNENRFSKIFFWGRIYGLENDYYLAFGYKTDCIRDCSFFYSFDCVEWFPLITPSESLSELQLMSPYIFRGIITNSTESQFKSEMEEEEIEMEICMSELDRLSSVAKLITDEAAIIPRGAICKRSDGIISHNPFFSGLEKENCYDLKVYQLCRYPRNQMEINLMRHKDYNYATDIFDSIVSIIPENASFTFAFDSQRQCVTIKSLQWPGMIFFHKLNTNLHGFYYSGDGIKNGDILFMVS